MKHRFHVHPKRVTHVPGPICHLCTRSEPGPAVALSDSGDSLRAVSAWGHAGKWRAGRYRPRGRRDGGMRRTAPRSHRYGRRSRGRTSREPCCHRRASRRRRPRGHFSSPPKGPTTARGTEHPARHQTPGASARPRALRGAGVPTCDPCRPPSLEDARRGRSARSGQPRHPFTEPSIAVRSSSKGKVSTGLTFGHADGSPYGTPVSPARADTSAQAFQTLRGLGFREGDVRRALREAAQGIGALASIEALVRHCLLGLTEGRARRA
jgi:hypothetical protein